MKRILSKPVRLPWKVPVKPSGQDTDIACSTLPLVGISTLPSRRISVDLPAPLRPSRAMR
jgi:hypothetical protein